MALIKEALLGRWIVFGFAASIFVSPPETPAQRGCSIRFPRPLLEALDELFTPSVVALDESKA